MSVCLKCYVSERNTGTGTRSTTADAKQLVRQSLSVNLSTHLIYCTGTGIFLKFKIMFQTGSGIMIFMNPALCYGSAFRS